MPSSIFAGVTELSEIVASPVTSPLPSKAAEVHAISPVAEIVRPVVSVSAEPVTLPVNVAASSLPTFAFKIVVTVALASVVFMFPVKSPVALPVRSPVTLPVTPPVAIAPVTQEQSQKQPQLRLKAKHERRQ